jgi:glutathione S-transferase
MQLAAGCVSGARTDAASLMNKHLARELSVADLMLYPSFTLRRSLVEHDDNCPNLRRWADNMASVPDVQRGMAYAD